MRLEDEIKVQKFHNERHKLSVNIIYTYNWLTSRMQRVFKRHGITMQQYNILRILRGQHPEPCTIQLLKERMLDKQPDASRLVDRLTAKGLAERKVCKDDRRKMDVLISEKGLELLEEMDEDMYGIENLFDCLSEQEAETINRLLDQARDHKDQ